MRVYKILALLLEYPDQELREHWDEIKLEIARLETDRRVLETFVAWAESLPLTELQAVYVKTFDLNPDNALYLTHHLFEEQDRERGPALVHLSEYFKTEGLELAGGELPDYLPLLLEYASTLDDATSARLFLRESAHVSEILARNLESIDSPYAPLLRLVARHGRLAGLTAA